MDQTIAPVEGERGEIEHFVAVNADITERTERQQQLKAERDRRKALFRNPNVPIVEIEFDDETPVIIDTNQAFTAVFGFAADAVAGRPVPDVIVSSVFVPSFGDGPGYPADRHDVDAADVYRALTQYHDHPEEMRAVERHREEAGKDHEHLRSDPDSVRN